MTAPFPGQIARFLHKRYYANEEAYLYALAEVMSAQYQAIVDARFVLQLDCPDLALSRHTVFAHLSLEAFRDMIPLHVEALNYAVRGIPPDRMRMHVCRGSTMGPHHTDVPPAGHHRCGAQRSPCGPVLPRSEPPSRA
jgi:5-methyltetrahydropteroyltriglutamate--homocysteine methyltransferase